MATAAGSFFRGLGQSATEKLRGWGDLGNFIQDAFRSQRTEFMRGTPEGTSILGRMDKYTEMKGQILGQVIQPIKGLKDAFKNDPSMLRKTLQDLHSSMPSNHPARQFSTQLLQDPSHAGMTLKEINSRAMMEAARQSHDAVFGKNNEFLSQDLMSLFSSPDPVMHSHANAILDILANQFHDTEVYRGRDPLFAGTEVSGTKMDIKKELLKENKSRGKAGLPPLPYDPEKLDVKSIYQKQNIIERLAARRTRIFLAPLIVLPHISTFFNFAWAPLTAIGKTLGSLSDKQIAQQVEASGIFNHLLHHMLDEDLRNSTGFLAQRTKPIFGRLFGEMFHNPGFSYLRKMQLWTSGILGYHSTMFWAEAAARGDSRAILELKEMGLDVNAIKARNGKLNPSELRQGIWNFVNNRAFIDRSMDRSMLSQSNPWMRLLTMFHGYVVNQQSFIRRELQKMMEAGDYKGLAQVAGTVGLVFPAVSPLLKSAEVLARTASVQQAGSGLEQDYATLSNPEDVGKWTLEYLDLLSHFAALGTLYSYLSSSRNDRLAVTVLGPVFGSAARGVQDLINFAFPTTKSGTHNIRPLAKDVLQQTLPGAGNIASNILFPPQKKGRQ